MGRNGQTVTVADALNHEIDECAMMYALAPQCIYVSDVCIEGSVVALPSSAANGWAVYLHYSDFLDLLEEMGLLAKLTQKVTQLCGLEVRYL